MSENRRKIILFYNPSSGNGLFKHYLDDIIGRCQDEGYMALRAIVGMALIPIVGRLALKFDRRQTLIGFNLLGTALMVLLRITGTTGTFTIVLYLFSVAISTWKMSERKLSSINLS